MANRPKKLQIALRPFPVKSSEKLFRNLWRTGVRNVRISSFLSKSSAAGFMDQESTNRAESKRGWSVLFQGVRNVRFFAFEMRKPPSDWQCRQNWRHSGRPHLKCELSRIGLQIHAVTESKTGLSGMVRMCTTLRKSAICDNRRQVRACLCFT